MGVGVGAGLEAGREERGLRRVGKSIGGSRCRSRGWSRNRKTRVGRERRESVEESREK